jgi:prepilin-type N-terminal cleavage/methylation domain-containing protein
MSLQRTQHSEDGFTFIEMIIAIVLSSMMLAALTGIFLTSTTNTRATAHRSNQSDDAQIIHTFLVADAQAAGGVDPQTAQLDASFGVFTNDPSACAVSGTVIRFRWIDPSNATYVDAVYRLSGTQMTRTVCSTPVFGGATTSSDIILAKTISAAFAKCTTGGVEGACNSGAVGDTAEKMPDSVRLSITATKANAAVATYTYSLDANLRTTHFAAADIPDSDNSAVAALITLGASCPPSAINQSPNTTLKIYGDVFLNSGADCITQGNNTELDYHTLTPGVSDPFAALPPPSTVGLPTRGGSCNGGVALPGVYPLAFSANNCTFQSGIYIFQNGLTLGGTIDATSGVLFYLSGGTLTTGNSAGENYQITAMSTGPYAGLAYWQVSATTINIGNNGLFKMLGTLYAPKAILYFSNNATQPQITTAIVLGVDLKNNSGANLGPAPKNLAVGANIPPAWTRNAPFTPVQVTATGGFGTYGYSMTGVPGLKIDSTTGVISGAPTSTGNQTMTITLTDSFNDTPAVATFPISINAAMTITNTSPLPGGNRNVFYSQTLARTGGTGPTYTWAVTGGALPDGLNLNASTGVISGTPTLVKAYNFTVTVTDSVGAMASKAFSLTIGTPPTITTLNPTSLGQGATGQNVIVTGTNFQVGVVATFSGTGITVNNTTRNSATQLTVTITIDPAAPTGARDVTVTNPDTGVVTKVGGFAVGPILASITPNSMKKGTSGTVTITGTGFINGASLDVTVSGTRVTPSNVTFVDAATITATFTLAGNAGTTARTVTVTNGDGTPSGNGVTFTVTK